LIDFSRAEQRRGLACSRKAKLGYGIKTCDTTKKTLGWMERPFDDDKIGTDRKSNADFARRTFGLFSSRFMDHSSVYRLTTGLWCPSIQRITKDCARWQIPQCRRPILPFTDLAHGGPDIADRRDNGEEWRIEAMLYLLHSMI
jgi:hypothetical protein